MTKQNIQPQFNYFLRQTKKFSEKYSGKCIAIYLDKVIGIGRDRIEAYEKAKKKYPKAKIGIFYIPTKKEVHMLI